MSIVIDMLHGSFGKKAWRNKKTDAAEHPEVFRRIGLLFNEPLASPGCPLSSHPKTNALSGSVAGSRITATHEPTSILQCMPMAIQGRAHGLATLPTATAIAWAVIGLCYPAIRRDTHEN